MTNQIYTTAQTAELLSVSINTLRSWKSRKADQLVEGQHWINQDNQVLWTQAGIEALQSINGATPSSADMQCPAVQEELEPIASPLQEPLADPLQRYNPLVESVSDALTQGLIGRIDNAVTRKVRSAIATPMSPQECLTVLQDLGLKPCNPEMLLTGHNQNLLTQSTEI